MEKPDLPWEIERAMEIFEAKLGDNNTEFLTYEEYWKAVRKRWIEESPFNWTQFGEDWVAGIQGRPSSVCEDCNNTVFKGRSSGGRDILVGETGRLHKCKGKRL